jgi:tRNA 2-thiouridine synthesizing protein A
MKSYLDLRGTICPINFVKTKLKLEELSSGDILEVLLDEGEPIRNVPRSVKEEGHRILNITRNKEHYSVLIEKVDV